MPTAGNMTTVLTAAARDGGARRYMRSGDYEDLSTEGQDYMRGTSKWNARMVNTATKAKMTTRMQINVVRDEKKAVHS